MSKRQEWAIAIIVIIIMLATIGVAYWYLTKDTDTQELNTENTQVQEQKDLANIESDLNGIEDLDLSALDAIEKDIQAIDLTEL